MGKVLYTSEAHVASGRAPGHGPAACFESALAAVARRKKLDPGDVEIDSKVMLVTGEERSFTVAVE